jgi:hypothetical protein
VAIHWHSAGACWVDRRYDAAVAICRNSVALFPEANWPRALLAQCLVDQGDYVEGLEVLDAELAVNKRQPLMAPEGSSRGSAGPRGAPGADDLWNRAGRTPI